MQEQTIWKVANDIALVHEKIDQLRHLYNLHENGDNVLQVARQEEIKYQQQIDQQMNHNEAQEGSRGVSKSDRFQAPPF